MCGKDNRQLKKYLRSKGYNTEVKIYNKEEAEKRIFIDTGMIRYFTFEYGKTRTISIKKVDSKKVVINPRFTVYPSIQHCVVVDHQRKSLSLYKKF